MSVYCYRSHKSRHNSPTQHVIYCNNGNIFHFLFRALFHYVRLEFISSIAVQLLRPSETKNGEILYIYIKKTFLVMLPLTWIMRDMEDMWRTERGFEGSSLWWWIDDLYQNMSCFRHILWLEEGDLTNGMYASFLSLTENNFFNELNLFGHLPTSPLCGNFHSCTHDYMI